ncbi:hypothetical protein Q669_29435 [Labrenzia sp. C1B10]|uniref:phage pre-tape measure protein n=1 Tax=unclassified Labrenzia TaxID=2648686 RepID=UPI0003B876AA|nr:MULTISPECIES: hypothetical protein [unclassified Labrenzia]ERP95694.1 hypothetical protein Q669_29435 [Labrenzia sp. C1B10]ERS05760.1 hypothetical protein Q675_29000 [Labrenzia sp. C1B70]
MSLKDYLVRKEEIPLGGGNSMQVRGLSAIDIGLIVARHRDAITQLVGQAADVTQGGKIGNMDVLIDVAMTQFPELVAEVICTAADEPEAHAEAMKLTLPIQLEAVYMIGNLTFEAEGGPKKTVETLIKVLNGLSGTMKSLKS